MKSLKAYLLCVALLSALCGVMAQTPEWLWANGMGAANRDEAKAIISDGNGNFYVAGYYYESATFGSTTLTSGGLWDIFVAKMDGDGNWLWATKAGGPTWDEAYSLTLDGAGNIYVSGWSNYATMSFGNILLTGGGAFIAKLDANGNWIWARNAARASGNGGAVGNSIVIDSDGNAYMTGFFQVTTSFGPFTPLCRGTEDIFVAKLDSDGNWLWVANAGGTSRDEGRGIALDSDGNVYLTGYFGFMGGAPATFGDIILTSNGDSDIFFAKLDSSGNWLWVTSAGGPRHGEEGRGIALDSAANVYVTGFFKGPVTFGNTTLTPTTENDTDMFVGKLDSDGNWIWVKSAEGSDVQESYAVALDNDANIYVTGSFQGIATFGTSTLANSGNFDLFVAKMDSNGNWLWATKAGGSSADFSFGITLDNAANIYVAGSFALTATFGTIPLTGSGDIDIFVAKLADAVGVSDDLNPPVIANSMSAWPNPFKQGTTLSVALDKTGFLGQDLRVSLYDLKGRKVRNLICGTSGGDELSLSWDGRDDGGVFCPNGIYLVKLFAGQRQISSAKVTLIR